MDNDTIQVVKQLLQEQEQRLMQKIDEKLAAEREQSRMDYCKLKEKYKQ